MRWYGVDQVEIRRPAGLLQALAHLADPVADDDDRAASHESLKTGAQIAPERAPHEHDIPVYFPFIPKITEKVCSVMSRSR